MCQPGAPDGAHEPLEQNVTIDRRKLPTEAMVGAVLWSLLIYPTDREADERAAHCAALVASHLAAEIVEGHDAEDGKALPAFVDLDLDAIKSGLRGARRRARDRLLAGWMLLQRLGIGIRPSGAPPPRRKPSIQALGERVMRMAGQSDVTNLLNRLWKPSQPVLHLAAAYQVIASKAEIGGEEEAASLILADRAHNDCIVRLASEVAQYVRADASLSRWSHRLIAINLVG